MAKDKKGFLLYADYIHIVKKMAKKGTEGKLQVADLFITILEYVNDMNPVPEDHMVDIIFEPIKQQLKRDLKSYEQTMEFKKENGALGNLKRWNKDLYDLVMSEKMTIQEAVFKADERKALMVAENRKPSHSDKKDRKPSQGVANVADNDNGNDTDNDTEKKDIDSRKLKFASTLKPFLEKYGKDMLNEFYKYWTEPNNSNTKFRRELEKTWSLERRLESWAKNDKNFKPMPQQQVTQKTGLA